MKYFLSETTHFVQTKSPARNNCTKKTYWKFLRKTNFSLATPLTKKTLLDYQSHLGQKKIPVFPLTYSKILGSVGRKKILFFNIFLARFYNGHILTLIVLIQKCSKKIRVGRVSGNTCIFFWP